MAAFSAACKTIHMSPLSKQYDDDEYDVGVVESDQEQILVSEPILMEMTEVEYTHLQHIIQTHMEAQAADPDGSDTRFPNAVFALGNLATQPGTVDDDDESTVVSPFSTTQAIDLSTSEPSHIHTVAKKLKTVLVGDDVVISGERTPTGSRRVPGNVWAKANVTRSEAPVTRPHPPARVCLEKRYSGLPGDVSRQHVQTAAFSKFLTILHQSTDAEEAAIYPQMHKWMRSDRTNPIELSQVYQGSIFNPTTGECGQAFGHIPHMIEPKGQNSVIYCSERVTQCITLTDQQQLVKNDAVAETAAPVKRVRRTRKTTKPDSKKVKSDGTSARKRAGRPMESSQRREIHNSRERDRRRRIRLCYDELNTLVPFCTWKTDKATTLQRTVSFLKYIIAVNGDSLKQGFHQETTETTSAPQPAEQ